MKQRVYALDELRGLAILLMVLSGTIPYGTLPAWMYHAQVPPPEHNFNPNLPGLTWVDLVFPFFLFALGAAIPLALQRFTTCRDQVRRIAGRAALLAAFAIMLQHVRPHQLMSQPDTATWLFALTGFVLLFGIYFRQPPGLGITRYRAIRITSWILMLVLIGQLSYRDGSGFSLQRSDIILLVLANMAFWGSLTWLLTQNRHSVRLWLLAVLMALRLGHESAAWLQYIWDISPVPWLFKVYYLQYLFIVIPGMYAGEWLLQEPPRTQKGSMVENTLLLLPLPVSLLAMQSREVAAGLMFSVIVLAVLWWYFYRGTENRLVLAGAALLLLGYLFEPFEGGIKKDHPTLSYYLLTSGLAFLLLRVLLNRDAQSKPGMLRRCLAANGRNPMIAYVAFANLVWPLLAVIGVERLLLTITGSPWLGFSRGLFYTAIVAVITAFFSHRKWYWRT
jgi:hypothetical protein